jgi:hypothetical protein
MVRLTLRTAAILLLAGAVWAAEAEEPDVRLRAVPRNSLAPLGGVTPILLTAEIEGPENEAYYCPEVVWVWPNGTRSSEESDCEPFEERREYPRRFTKRIAAHAYARDYVVCVELRKSGEAVNRSCARFRVR